MDFNAEAEKIEKNFKKASGKDSKKDEVKKDAVIWIHEALDKKEKQKNQK